MVLLFLGQIVVADAIPLESQGHRYRPGRQQKTILHRLVQGVLVGQEDRELLVPRLEIGFQSLKLVQSLPGDGRGGGKQAGVECETGRGAGAAGIGMRQPVGDVEKFLHGHDGIGAQDGTMAVDGLVAELGDDPGLVEYGVAGGGIVDGGPFGLEEGEEG